MNPVRERAIAELRRIVLDALGEHDAAVWLFGSCARDEVRHPDDIDVAIFPRDELPSEFFAELVDLRGADPALLDEVLWTGIRWRD